MTSMLKTSNKREYKIIKSKNFKRISISIKRSQNVVVSAPKGVSDKRINSFVDKNRTWIDNNLQKLQNDEKTKKHTFEEGDVFLLFGQLNSLKFIETNDKEFLKIDKIIDNININFEKNVIEIKIYEKLSLESKAYIVSEFFREETRKIIFKQFNKNKILKNLKPLIKNVKISKSNSRWGSCSADNNLNFSYRLAMLPLSCIDYVILHEVVHLKEKNHSKSFYNQLKIVCPNYKLYENQIKTISFNHNLHLA